MMHPTLWGAVISTSPQQSIGTEPEGAAEAELLRRLQTAVADFDRGACPEEATAELTPELYKSLPQGPVRRAVRPMFVHLAADPPRPNREGAVRTALIAVEACGPDREE